MASPSPLADFIAATRELQSFDLKYGDTTLTLFWRELRAEDPQPDTATIYEEVMQKKGMTDRDKQAEVVRRKWEEETFLKLQVGMKEAGQEEFTRTHWEMFPPLLKEVIYGNTGLVMENFIDGSKKTQTP